MNEMPGGLCQCGCGSPTTIVRRSHASRGLRKGEPRRYLPKHHSRMTMTDTIARFWSKVQKGPGCWEWQTYRDEDGYGQFYFRGRTRSAHRIAWEITYGPIANGLWVLHECDNPPCVRPDHLYLGTATDNNRDTVNRGRHVTPDCRGERNHSVKLTVAQVVEIRTTFAQGGCTQQQLADAYSVDHRTVSAIITGKNWSCLDGGGMRVRG